MSNDSFKIGQKLEFKPLVKPQIAKEKVETMPVQDNTLGRVKELELTANIQKAKVQGFFETPFEVPLDLNGGNGEIFALTNTGRASESGSGKEAAERLKNEDNYFTAEWENFRAKDYWETINLHKNDPAFLRELYENLGPELTAELMGRIAGLAKEDNHQDFPTENDIKNTYQTIAASLSLMPPEFQREVGLKAAVNNPSAAMIFSQPQATNDVRRGFLDGIKDKALGDGYDSSYAARMAGDVLSADPQLIKEYLAGGLKSDERWMSPKWSAEEVSKLFKNGLSMPPEGGYYHHDWVTTKGEGLERIVGMLSEFKGPEYSDFRARVFRDAASILKDTHTGDSNRQSLVDNLKKLFLSDPRGLVDKLFNNTGLPDSPYDSSGQALSLFFREALFANPEPDGEFVNAVSKLMGDIRADMLNPDNVGKTPNNEYYGKILGDVLGSVAAGYTRAIAHNGEDQKAREALVGTLVDMIAKPIDVSGGQVGSMAKDQAEALAKSLLSDFLNGDLKADAKGMREILDKLFESAFAGARDFDNKYHTNVETNVKVETIWVDFLRDLFG